MLLGQADPWIRKRISGVSFYAAPQRGKDQRVLQRQKEQRIRQDALIVAEPDRREHPHDAAPLE
jgi:hypothetical protein